MTWLSALNEVGCYDFLGPVAAASVDAVYERCPEAASMVGDDARDSMRELCLARLALVYERPLLKRVLARGRFAEPSRMLRFARDVRDEVMADGGASLREEVPFASGYEQAIADNFSDAMVEFLERLVLRRDDISRELLDGRPITRLFGISAQGADFHRHGRAVMRVDTDAGPFYHKPHDCTLDVLFTELVGTWFGNCARTPGLVTGEGYAFVECLVPKELADEGELREYWSNFGCLAALFNALGSRDMTQDNIMCCGVFPAVLDLETLLTGEPDFDTEALGESIPESPLVSTAVLPVRVGAKLVSPLAADNATGTCLPRVGGEARTVAGFEHAFSRGFEEGYQRLMSHREDVLALLERFGDASCRQLLLNTWAYGRARSLLFSPGAMSDPTRRGEVLEELNRGYAVFSPELGERVAPYDAAALREGDIPYYFSRANSRMLFSADGGAVGELLAKSALDVVSGRLARLSEDDLQFELGLIGEHLSGWEELGDRP